MTATVLVVDDEPDLEALVLQKFRRQIRDGLVNFVFARDGLEALQSIEQYPHVDLVVSDINMPRMDGYDVIRNLRKDPAHKSTPILVLTTESEAEKKNLAREAGATGWMVKPFDPERLIATVRKVAP
jgi:adenylate cyclase